MPAVCKVRVNLLVAAAVLLSASHAPALASSGCAPNILLEARAEQVIDAATLRLDDGNQVRLIGALPPETPGWWKKTEVWPPLKAAQKTLARMVEGRRVILKTSPDEAERDRHGRYLAQLYVREGDAERWVQGELVGAGYALAYSFSGHKTCARALLAREEQARTSRLGLWRSRRFMVHKTDKTDVLLKRLGSYQIVKGRVVSVGVTRNWTFLNFSNDWRSDFTVAIAAGNRKQFDSLPVVLSELEDKHIRVRGWVERWNGPAIKATHGEQIEVIQESN